MKFIPMLLLCLSALGGEEGKVFVQSDPAGASIFVLANGELKDSGVKTPGMVTLPKGPSTLMLRKAGLEDKDVVVVAGDAISKAEVVKLEPPTVEVEVTSADPGWRVFVDGKPLKDKLGKKAVTPCTVLMPVGTYQIGWAKDGSADVVEKLTTDKATVSVDMKAKPRVGKSALLVMRRELIPGFYRAVYPSRQERFQLMEDGTLRLIGSIDARDSWEFKDNTLIIHWPRWNLTEVLTYDRATGQFAKKEVGFTMTQE